MKTYLTIPVKSQYLNEVIDLLKSRGYDDVATSKTNPMGAAATKTTTNTADGLTKESAHTEEGKTMNINLNGYPAERVKRDRLDETLEQWIDSQPEDFQDYFWDFFYGSGFTIFDLQELLVESSDGKYFETSPYFHSVEDVAELVEKYYKTGIIPAGASHLFGGEECDALDGEDFVDPADLNADDSSADGDDSAEDASTDDDDVASRYAPLLPLEEWLIDQPGSVQDAFWATVHTTSDGRRKIHASLQKLSDAGITRTPYPFSSDEAVRSVLNKRRNAHSKRLNPANTMKYFSTKEGDN